MARMGMSKRCAVARCRGADPARRFAETSLKRQANRAALHSTLLFRVGAGLPRPIPAREVATFCHLAPALDSVIQHTDCVKIIPISSTSISAGSRQPTGRVSSAGACADSAALSTDAACSRRAVPTRTSRAARTLRLRA
eukprot:6177323-Pleurochrysis_carterae.AAC.4